MTEKKYGHRIGCAPYLLSAFTPRCTNSTIPQCIAYLHHPIDVCPLPPLHYILISCTAVGEMWWCVTPPCVKYRMEFLSHGAPTPHIPQGTTYIQSTSWVIGWESTFLALKLYWPPLADLCVVYWIPVWLVVYAKVNEHVYLRTPDNHRKSIPKAE